MSGGFGAVVEARLLDTPVLVENLKKVLAGGPNVFGVAVSHDEWSVR